MEYRRFFNGLVASGAAYSSFARTISQPATPQRVLIMDEVSTFPRRAVKTRPPKRPGENRQQYRERLHASGIL